MAFLLTGAEKAFVVNTLEEGKVGEWSCVGFAWLFWGVWENKAAEGRVSMRGVQVDMLLVDWFLVMIVCLMICCKVYRVC